MTSFEIVHQQRVVGKLACFDRLIFKGHLTGLFGAGRFTAFLASQGVLLKDFAPDVKRVSEQVKAHAQAQATAAGRPYVYLEGARRPPGRSPVAAPATSSVTLGQRDAVPQAMAASTGPAERWSDCRNGDGLARHERAY